LDELGAAVRKRDGHGMQRALGKLAAHEDVLQRFCTNPVLREAFPRFKKFLP
jgi:hypothetical protein